MKRLVLLMGAVMLLLPHALTQKDWHTNWDQYLMDEVVVDDMNITEAIIPGKAIANAIEKEAIATIKPEESEFWTVDKDVPYAALLYSTVNFKTCGGALLTSDVVMTICSCVASYLSSYFGGGNKIFKAAFALKEDIDDPIKVKFNIGYYPYSKKAPDFEDTSEPVRIDNKDKKQLKNERCMEAFKDATKNLNKQWEQRTSIALIRLTGERNEDLGYAPYVPWPPIPLTYDMQLKEFNGTESNMWVMHRSRPVESFSISSLEFQLSHRSKKIFKDLFGNIYDPEDYRLKFRPALCFQTYCGYGRFPRLNEVMPEDIRKTFSCVCDPNGIDTVCAGLIGTPVMHDGDLHGLLTHVWECDNTYPRTNLVLAFDGKAIDWVTAVLPELRQRVLEAGDVTNFREGALVGNYDIFIPKFLPGDDIYNKEIQGPAGRSKAASFNPRNTLQLFCTVQMFSSIVFLKY